MMVYRSAMATNVIPSITGHNEWLRFIQAFYNAGLATKFAWYIIQEPYTVCTVPLPADRFARTLSLTRLNSVSRTSTLSTFRHDNICGFNVTVNNIPDVKMLNFLDNFFSDEYLTGKGP